MEIGTKAVRLTDVLFESIVCILLVANLSTAGCTTVGEKSERWGRAADRFINADCVVLHYERDKNEDGAEILSGWEKRGFGKGCEEITEQ